MYFPIREFPISILAKKPLSLTLFPSELGDRATSCSPNGNPRMEDPRGAEGGEGEGDDGGRLGQHPADDAAVRPSALSTRPLLPSFPPSPFYKLFMFMSRRTAVLAGGGDDATDHVPKAAAAAHFFFRAGRVALVN